MIRRRPRRRADTTPPRRRGSIYVVTLAVAMIVAVLGLAGLEVVRVRRGQMAAQGQSVEAQLYARSAVDLALFRIDNDPDWRSRFRDGAWKDEQPLGSGSCAIEAFDPLDGDLTDSAFNPVEIVGIGRSGAAVHRLQVRLDPQLPPSSGQLLGNADMEAAQAAPWVPYSCSASISSKSHTGAQSLRVHGRNGEWDVIGQDVTAQVVRSALHRAEVWIHQAADEPAASYRILLMIDSSQGDMQFVPLSEWTLCCCDQWTKLEGDAVVEWSGDLETAAWFVQSNLGSVPYRIDDALFESQAAPTVFHIAPGSWRQRVE